MPVVTSATPAYLRAMRWGLEDLACRDKGEWEITLERIIGDESLRRDAAGRGRELAETRFGKEVTLARWDAVFASLGFHFDAGVRPL